MSHYDQAGTQITPPEFHNGHVCHFHSWLEAHSSMHSEPGHRKLKEILIKNIWRRSGASTTRTKSFFRYSLPFHEVPI